MIGDNVYYFTGFYNIAELHTVLAALRVDFSQRLPGDEAALREDRAKIISSALSKVEDAVVKVTALWGVSEDTSRAHFKEPEPYIKSFLLVFGE